MPSIRTYGTPSEANEAIEGVPTIHYFDFKSRGRAQVVRLMWEVSRFPQVLQLLGSPEIEQASVSVQDAGIAYKDVRYSFEEFPSFKEGWLQEMNPLGTIPVVEVGDRLLTQSMPW